MRYPDSQIDYLVGKGCKAVLENNPNINNVITFDSSIMFKKKLWRMGGLVRIISGYDTVYVLDKHWIFNLLAWLSRAKSVGFVRDRPSKWLLDRSVEYGNVRHEIHYYLDLLEGADHDDVRLDIFVSEEAAKKVAGYIAKNDLEDYYVFVNSGGDNAGEAGGIRKLPDDVFRKILGKLDLPVLLVGGPNDKKYYDRFVSENVINTAGEFSIEQSAALMKHAKRVHTTDSGPMHMAAAGGASMTVYFGPTNPARKAPLVDDIEITWKDQDIYDECYELYGKFPKGEFFGDLR
jgi:ADP-heptose:LPS heptosyltransferase